jgi:cyclic pyranopterin phosphate synthase
MSQAFGGPKVLHHPDRVLRAVRDDFGFYPVTVHFGLMSKCNHRCVWCSDLDYRAKYNGVFSFEVLQRTLQDLADGGTRSVNWTGSGESTMHPQFVEITKTAARLGFQQSCITNGTGLDKIDPSLFSWVRVSLDAGTAKVHRKLHGTQDFREILDSMRRFKDRRGSVLGVSYLVHPDNASDVARIIPILDEIGVDYIRIKADALNPTKRFEPDGPPAFVLPEEEPKHLKLFFDDKREPGNAGLPCRAASFHAWVAPSGDVFMCCRLANTDRDEEVWIGNLDGEHPWKRVWESERRQEVVRRFQDVRETARCPTCSLTRFNVALEEIASDEIAQRSMLFV